jgi:dihydroorotate dehydrogenase electron transfer subunit
MKQEYIETKVKENIPVEEDIYRITIEGSFKAEPGQFYMLRAWEEEPVLSRPVSVNYVNEDSIVFLYQVKGRGTELLKNLEAGDNIKLLGPCGNGFHTERLGGKIAIIGGGIGIAPMLYTAASLKNCQVDVYAGFRSESYLMDEFRKAAENVYVATEDGTEGHKGYVTEIFNPWEYTSVLCCGPQIMMERVVEMCQSSATPVWVSMEKHMACGIGACLVCTCSTRQGAKRTCKDGPVFSGREVEWDA